MSKKTIEELRNMGLVEFAETVLELELTDWQKESLRLFEQGERFIIARRGKYLEAVKKLAEQDDKVFNDPKIREEAFELAKKYRLTAKDLDEPFTI